MGLGPVGCECAPTESATLLAGPMFTENVIPSKSARSVGVVLLGGHAVSQKIGARQVARFPGCGTFDYVRHRSPPLLVS